MTFCSYCGHAMETQAGWPKHCESCGRAFFKNPIPVSVVLLPVDDGVLTVRRAIPPGEGQLALPGGFVNWGETWQEAGARELFEETGLTVSPEELELISAESVDEGVLLLFSQARPRQRDQLHWIHDPSEISEIVVLTEAKELAFSTHTAQLRAYFEREADCGSPQPEPGR